MGKQWEFRLKTSAHMIILEYKAIWPVPNPPSTVVAQFARHLAIQTAQPEVLLHIRYLHQHQKHIEQKHTPTS